jgi:hypothetical protein
MKFAFEVYNVVTKDVGKELMALYQHQYYTYFRNLQALWLQAIQWWFQWDKSYTICSTFSWCNYQDHRVGKDLIPSWKSSLACKFLLKKQLIIVTLCLTCSLRLN